MTALPEIAVIGAGTLGWQIALVLAGHGNTVRLHDRAPAAVAAALEQIGEQAPGLAAEGWLPPAAAHVHERVLPAGTLTEAVGGAWLAIEAIPERLDLKRALYAELSAAAPANVVLATNSSSFKSRLLADATAHPERLMNAHFYGMPWRRPAVELMTCGVTRPEHLERVAEALRRCRFVPFIVKGESTGFIYNRIWHAIKKETLKVVAEGLASPEEVDRLWCLVMGTPLGPCAMMDRVGLDVVQDIERHYAAESGRPDDAPPAFLAEMVDRGLLGQKAGRGFYRYPEPAYQRPGWPREAGEDTPAGA